MNLRGNTIQSITMVSSSPFSFYLSETCYLFGSLRLVLYSFCCFLSPNLFALFPKPFVENFLIAVKILISQDLLFFLKKKNVFIENILCLFYGSTVSSNFWGYKLLFWKTFFFFLQISILASNFHVGGLLQVSGILGCYLVTEGLNWWGPKDFELHCMVVQVSPFWENADVWEVFPLVWGSWGEHSICLRAEGLATSFLFVCFWCKELDFSFPHFW